MMRRISREMPQRAIAGSLGALESEKVKSMGGSLDQALYALEKTYEFLLKEDVFTSDAVETWLEFKRNMTSMRSVFAHPWEFVLYSDI